MVAQKKKILSASGWTYVFAGCNLVYVLPVGEDDVLPVCMLTYIAKCEQTPNYTLRFALLCFDFVFSSEHGNTGCSLWTWHDDGPVGFQGLGVDLDGRHGVVTGVPVQQVALRTRRNGTAVVRFQPLHASLDPSGRHLPERSPATTSSPSGS